MRCLVLALGLLAACEPASAPPRVEAHRAGAGYWPANSLLAVQGVVDFELPGMEIDLVLTADGVPVLSHDPWLSHTTCVRPNGAAVEAESLLIQDLTLAELKRDYRCGARPDPAFPNALVHAAPLATLDEVLGLLRWHRGPLTVHLDIKQEPGLTPEPELFAEAVLSRWWAAQLPHALSVSANRPAVLQAFDDAGRLAGRDVPTVLIWPRFAPGAEGEAEQVRVVVDAALADVTGTGSAVVDAVEAGADSLGLYWELADRGLVAEARAEGLGVQLWTPNDPATLKRLLGWPVEALITDYPLDAELVGERP